MRRGGKGRLRSDLAASFHPSICSCRNTPMAVKQSLATSLLALGLLACGGATSAPHVRTQLLSGTAAPSGLTFASFGRAAANAHGTVCFLAGWDGLRHRPEGLFIRQGDQVTPIARAGHPVPGSAGD